MRIAVAPNAFRGSLTALQATACITAGLEQSALARIGPLQIIPMPLADGGDGTLEILVHGLGGARQKLAVTGPDGSPVEAEIGLLADSQADSQADRQTAVIEMARASGIELIPPARRNPLLTTTYGTGELIRAALNRGCRRLMIGIGGSATVDGGAGCLQALGARLLDQSGEAIRPGGGALAQLASIDVTVLRPLFAGVEVTILCDVTNPLIGPNGAARIFGPQKGADADMIERLEANLTHFAAVIRRDLGLDVTQMPGGGAAGGFGAGMVAFLGAKLAPGATTLIDLLGYEQQLTRLDLVITGEGKLDAQTGGGKAVQRITEVANRAGVPVVAFAGTLDADSAALKAMGIEAAWSIVPGPCTLETAIAQAPAWLTRASVMLGNLLALRRTK
jgi:glycerate kinase